MQTNKLFIGTDSFEVQLSRWRYFYIKPKANNHLLFYLLMQFIEISMLKPSKAYSGQITVSSSS